MTGRTEPLRTPAVSRLKIPGTWLTMSALCLAVLLWGGSFVAMKIGVSAMSPWPLMWIRMSLAGVIMLPLAGRLWPRDYCPGDWKPLLGMILLMPCLHFVLGAYGAALTSASQAGVISASIPLLVALGGGFFLGERIGPRIWIGMLVSAGCVAWLTLAGAVSPGAANPLLGNLLIALAMVAAAGYMLILKSISGRYNPWSLTTLQTLAGTIFFLPGAPEALTRIEAGLSPAVIGSLVFLGVGVSLGAFGLYNWAISRIPAGRASAFINLVPAMAVLNGWLFLDESLNLAQILASAGVLGGVILSQSGTGKGS